VIIKNISQKQRSFTIKGGTTVNLFDPQRPQTTIQASEMGIETVLAFRLEEVILATQAEAQEDIADLEEQKLHFQQKLKSAIRKNKPAKAKLHEKKLQEIEQKLKDREQLKQSVSSQSSNASSDSKGTDDAVTFSLQPNAVQNVAVYLLFRRKDSKVVFSVPISATGVLQVYESKNKEFQKEITWTSSLSVNTLSSTGEQKRPTTSESVSIPDKPSSSSSSSNSASHTPDTPSHVHPSTTSTSSTAPKTELQQSRGLADYIRFLELPDQGLSAYSFPPAVCLSSFCSVSLCRCSRCRLLLR
jgi:hypothetical protein